MKMYLQAIQNLIDHAQERYPHFESERGKKDIADAKTALGTLVKTFTDAQTAIDTLVASSKKNRP